MFEIFHTIFRYKEKDSPDVLGLFPERVHVDAMPERRYLWTSRVLVIISCINICICAMLSLAIYVMLPQRTVYPRFLRINNYFSQLEEVEADEVNYSVSDLVTEANIRDYILRRYLISDDYDEMINRWRIGSTFYWFSSGNIYKEFIEGEAVNNIELYREKDLIRGVTIDWVKALAFNIWQVQFQTTDVSPDFDEPYTTVWRATLRVGYFDIPHTQRNDAILNPFGFLVTGYSLAFHSNPESRASYIDIIRKQAEDKYK